jgi:hypothetical protein
MKALVWHGERRYAVEDLPDPKAGPGEVVVRVEAAAVCTSDFHMSDFGAQPPLAAQSDTAKARRPISDWLHLIEFPSRADCASRGRKHTRGSSTVQRSGFPMSNRVPD